MESVTCKVQIEMNDPKSLIISNLKEYLLKKKKQTLKHSRMQDVEVEIHLKKIQWAVISNSFQHVHGIGTHVIL